MSVPKNSVNGSCPTCSGTDWKLAKMMFLAGHSTVNTESSGGGFGAGAGVGRGHGGVGINYQGVNLNTTGSHVTGITLEYAPPQPPAHYEKKATLLQECSALLIEAEDAIGKVNLFAHQTESVKPGLFNQANADRIHGCERRYATRLEQLQSIQSYEHSIALWNRTRVCARCGESFVTQEEKSTPEVGFDTPIFHFSGMDRKCSKCNSYQWKTAQAFFKIKVDGLQGEVLKREEAMNVAIADERATIANEGGILKRFARKLFSVKPEDAMLKLAESETRLSEALAVRDKVMERPDFKQLRVCSSCEATYTI